MCGKKMCLGPLKDLSKPQTRLELYKRIRCNEYKISPPRSILIPKDGKNEFREVFVNTDIDRLILSIANDLFSEMMPEMIHYSCKSYQRGLGCGKVVMNVSRKIMSISSDLQSSVEIGWKADLSKYFDSVPIKIIDSVFDKIEDKYGPSALITLIRSYYHSEDYIDNDVVLKQKFMSLRQGCAVSAFLANVVLFNLDKRMSSLDGYYVRYSDDMVFVGKDYEKAMDILLQELNKMGLSLNPKKLSSIYNDRWFTFLGYSIKGKLISLSPHQIKSFQAGVLHCIVSKCMSQKSAVKKS